MLRVILQEEQEEEEEIEDVYIPYSPPVARPWNSLGSEVDIDEETVAESRKKVGISVQMTWNVSLSSAGYLLECL